MSAITVPGDRFWDEVASTLNIGVSDSTTEGFLEQAARAASAEIFSRYDLGMWPLLDDGPVTPDGSCAQTGRLASHPDWNLTRKDFMLAPRARAAPETHFHVDVIDDVGPDNGLNYAALGTVRTSTKKESGSRFFGAVYLMPGSGREPHDRGVRYIDTYVSPFSENNERMAGVAEAFIAAVKKYRAGTRELAVH